MTVSQRKAGVLLSYAGQLVHILTGLIYTPVMLRLLGQSEYGLYQLVYSVVSYLSLLSLGFASSYMRFYAREKAKKDEYEIAKLNGMFLIIFLTIAIVAIFCGIVMVLNIRHIFNKGLTETEYKTARILMGIMVINLALTFPNSVFNCIITSQERFLFQKALILIHYILNPFLTLPLLLMGYGSIGMVAITTFLTMCVLVCNIYYCFKILHCSFVFHGLKVGLLQEMGAFTFFIFLNQIIDQVNLSVDKFLLGRIIGTTAVAIYGVGSQINALYMQLSSSVSNVFVPKVNLIVAERNDNKELSKLFTKVGRVQFFIITLILSGFAIFGVPFIKYWAGAGYDESYYVALMLMFSVSIPLIQNLGVEIQRAKNKHKTRSVVYFAIAIGNVFVSVPLIKQFGPIGATLGTAIALLIGNIIFMNWYYYKKLGIDIPTFWKSIASVLPGVSLSVLLGAVGVKMVPPASPIVLIIEIAIYALLYCNIVFFISMNDEEKRMVSGLIKKVKKKKGDTYSD